MGDIWKLLYILDILLYILFETILKYHKGYLCQISGTNHAIICLYYYTTSKRFVISPVGISNQAEIPLL